MPRRPHDNRRLPAHATLAALLALAAGCVEQAPPQDYGDPTSLNSPTVEGGIYAWVEQPRAAATLVAPEVELAVAAYTEDASPLTVMVGASGGTLFPASPLGEPGPDQVFVRTVALSHGVNPLEIHVATRDGARRRAFDYDIPYLGRAPGVRVIEVAAATAEGCAGARPLRGDLTGALNVCVRGQVSAAEGREVERVELRVDGEGSAPVSFNADGVFDAHVALAPDAATLVEVVATDDQGATSATSASVRQDGTPPELALTSEPPQGPTTEESLALEGTADDPAGVVELYVEGALGGYQPIPLASAWSTRVQLAEGDNALTVVAVDAVGNEARLPVGVSRQRVIHLGPPAQTEGGARLELDRFALESLLSEEDQRAIVLTELELRPAIVAAMEVIASPESFGVDTGGWGTAERNLNRLLNMTPDNADLRGTSIEELLALGAAVGLPSPRLLAELMALDVSDTIVDIEVVADALLTHFIGTHPNTSRNDEGAVTIKLTMYDVLQDLEPVAPRLGPLDGHPGVLDGATDKAVLEPGFLLTIRATSNLQQYDAVDASAGSKAYHFVSTGDQVLEFDFLDPDAFDVVGLVDAPTVDLSFSIAESPTFASAGSDRGAMADPERPGFARGDGEVWSLPPWTLEYVVAEAAYLDFHDLHADSSYAATFAYDAGAIDDAAVIDWDRGWVEIATSGGIGNPPQPLYVWDMIAEVAQVRLHDGGLAEGEAGVAFSLKDLSIGLEAEELVDALRPSLQAQQDTLSELIVGTSGVTTSSADAFFVPAEPAPLLFGRDDPRWATPGFFADAALTDKRSTTSPLPGTEDAAHEKVALAPGQVLFFADDTGAVYRLTVFEERQDGVGVVVEPAEAP